MDWQLFFGDSLACMAQIPDGSVDLVAADLPYGTTACRWDAVIQFAPLWDQYRRLLKPCGVIALTAVQPFTSALVMSNPEWFRYCWAWHKVSPAGFLNSHYRPMKVMEDIAVFSPAGASSRSEKFGKAVMTYNPQGLVSTYITKINNRGKERERFGYPKNGNSIASGSSYEQHNKGYPSDFLQFERDKSKLHPTQKPVDLFEYLIRTYSNEGETVLDNTMGSGTTGIACLNTGRNFIGIENNPEYFLLAEQRIQFAIKEKDEQGKAIVAGAESLVDTAGDTKAQRIV